jgi:hypothetical protein
LSASTCKGELPRNKQSWTDCRANHLSKSSPGRRWVGARIINRAPKLPATVQEHHVSAPLRRGFSRSQDPTLQSVAARSRGWLPPKGSSAPAVRREADKDGVVDLKLQRLQGVVTQTVWVALAGFPKLHDLRRERLTNWVRAVTRSDASAISKARPVRQTLRCTVSDFPLAELVSWSERGPALLPRSE